MLLRLWGIIMLLTRLRSAVLACVLAALPLWAHAQDADVERLRIHGSNTVGERLMPALVKSWLRASGFEAISERSRGPSTLEIHAERDGTPLVVEIGKRGSAAGLSDLIEGNAELAMMARTPNARERDAAWQLGDLASSDQEYVLAVDGVTVIVNQANPVRELSVAQLRAIYAGRIRNWSQLGGPDRPIHLQLTSARTASGEYFREAVMAGAADGAGATERRVALDPAAGIQVGAEQVASVVARDIGAIGVIGLRSRVPASARPLAISDGGEGVYPTPLNLLSEDYPLTRRYSLYGGQLMSALGRSFAVYSVTRRAQEDVAATGHFAVTLRPAPQPPMPKASGEYQRVVVGAQRLPVSLRFNLGNGSSIFDSRAILDLDRLVAYMHLPQNRGRQAVLVAFGNADKAGPMVATLISTDRADIIAGYLQERGVVVRSSNGLGTLRPLAAPTRADARFRNERVEVWVI